MVRRTAIRIGRKVPDRITVGDLVAYGWAGLVDAYRRADPAMPVEEFDAYAAYRVRGAMLDYLRSLDATTRDLRRASRKVTETIRDLEAKSGRTAEEGEIAKAMGLEVEAYYAILDRISAAGMARLELLDIDALDADAGSDASDDEAGTKQLAHAVAEAVPTLPLAAQQVLALRYQEQCTLAEIAAVLEITESRARQLYTEAMHRLRARIGRT